MSRVDESLFGKPARKTMTRALPSNAVVVSASELAAIRARSIVRSPAEEMQQRAEREAALEEKQRISKARKQKMLEKEESSKAKAKKSDVEVAKIERERTIRDLAEKQIDESLDMVKMLNSLGARAAAFTIRDKQLAERDHRMEHEGDYDKRMDLMMEIDRLKDLAERDQIEDEKRRKRYEDREVIVGQIKLREREKMLAEEARERENQQMRALVKKYEDDDAKAVAKRKVEVERSKKEIVVANAESIRRKQDAKLKEIQEMEDLRMYQLKKDAELAEREAYEEALANEKKEQQKKLLAAQEKSQNKQSEIDELRARRYAEAAERKARNEEKDKAERRRQQMVELAGARKAQADGKKAILAREAVMQQQEYEDAMRYSVKVQEREAAENTRKKSAAESHRIKLQTQIDDRADVRKRTQSKKWEEGQKLKDEFIGERAKLGAIRDKMVEDLKKKGVDPKYLAEMRRCDIQKIQMR
mmetsp:Transcript_27423/g.61301  ORF Transcript_27423/g.61301 Transcript_27423/m.61301 type:complete len:474 (+) Transcript_27423:86-1507(+)